MYKYRCITQTTTWHKLWRPFSSVSILLSAFLKRHVCVYIFDAIGWYSKTYLKLDKVLQSTQIWFNLIDDHFIKICCMSPKIKLTLILVVLQCVHRKKQYVPTYRHSLHFYANSKFHGFGWIPRPFRVTKLTVFNAGVQFMFRINL